MISPTATVDPNAERKRAKIRLLFAVVILLQPVQYLVASRFGEPYPAFMMPGFSGTMTDRDGTVRLTNVKCKVDFRDGRVEWLSANDLLAQAPDSYRMSIMFHMFSLPPASGAEWQPPAFEARLFPGLAFARARQAQQELDPETKEWLKTRMETLYPSRKVEAVTFVWYEIIFSANQTSPEAADRPIGKREVRFQ